LLTMISVDERRTKLVLAERYEELVETYNQNYCAFLDQNNKNFWENKILNEVNNDFLTSRRVGIVIREMVRHGGKKLLDVGVGQAYLENRIIQKGLNIPIFGVDIVDPIFYKNLPHFKYRQVKNYKKLPYKNDAFAVMTCLDVLEHIEPKDLFSILKEFYRVLKRCGVLIVSVPVNENLEKISYYSKLHKKYVNPNSHLRDYNKNLISWELNHCGFKVNKIYEIIAFRRFGRLLTLVNTILRKWKPNNLVLLATKP